MARRRGSGIHTSHLLLAGGSLAALYLLTRNGAATPADDSSGGTDIFGQIIDWLKQVEANNAALINQAGAKTPPTSPTLPQYQAADHTGTLPQTASGLTARWTNPGNSDTGNFSPSQISQIMASGDVSSTISGGVQSLYTSLDTAYAVLNGGAVQTNNLGQEMGTPGGYAPAINSEAQSAAAGLVHLGTPIGSGTSQAIPTGQDAAGDVYNTAGAITGAVVGSQASQSLSQQFLNQKAQGNTQSYSNWLKKK